MSASNSARTYNQSHVRRKYTPGRRRVSIYITWSYPAERGRDPCELDNRFFARAELRLVAWPAYEGPVWWSRRQCQEGIAGPLVLFGRAWVPFQEFAQETTGHAAPVFWRIDHARVKLP